jgi:serine/threonine protein kinase
MDFSVENLCGLLIRSKLLSPDEVKTVYQGWQTAARDNASNAPQFLRWLVSNQHLTEYQAGLLGKGHADDFFINQYRILDRLGRGRMAGVYKAVHQLGQIVAIKVLPPSKAKDPQVLARFQREARLNARLKHPNVVRCFQIGQTNDLHYLVLEYLDGETLEEVLQRRKRLPPHEAVRIVHQALAGLQHIHEQGMIHRDLKPGNLMLVPGRQPGEPDSTLQATVKIMDIGLGRQLFEEGGVPADPTLTKLGVLLGTPEYLSPEQAKDPHTADIRADIYSLGCVLYHCLTGQPPFPDSNVLNQILRHATETPRPVRELNPAVPDGLQQILNWMMAKEPGQRYPTPERAAQALQVFLVAGDSPAKNIEEAPQMRRYLTWLETGSDSPEKETRPPPIPAAPVATPVAPPVPRLQESPAKAAPKPAEVHRHRGKKHRRHKYFDETTAALTNPPAPVALPVAPLEVPDQTEQFDVELVSAPAPLLAPPPSAKATGLGLSRRDWLLLGIGAACVIFAVLVGWGLAVAFRQ